MRGGTSGEEEQFADVFIQDRLQEKSLQRQRDGRGSISSVVDLGMNLRQKEMIEGMKINTGQYHNDGLRQDPPIMNDMNHTIMRWNPK